MQLQKKEKCCGCRACEQITCICDRNYQKLKNGFICNPYHEQKIIDDLVSKDIQLDDIVTTAGMIYLM